MSGFVEGERDTQMGFLQIGMENWASGMLSQCKHCWPAECCRHALKSEVYLYHKILFIAAVIQQTTGEEKQQRTMGEKNSLFQYSNNLTHSQWYSRTCLYLTGRASSLHRAERPIQSLNQGQMSDYPVTFQNMIQVNQIVYVCVWVTEYIIKHYQCCSIVMMWLSLCSTLNTIETTQ